MNQPTNSILKKTFISIAMLTTLSFIPQLAHASPFGDGTFGADVPFGTTTTLSIDLGSTVDITLLPSGGSLSGTGQHTVTVSSTDVVGYSLYAYAYATADMSSGSEIIAKSSNAIAAPLALGTWGYNTTNSTVNFLGMGTTPVLLKDASGPHKNGDPTVITYGTSISDTQAAGTYTIPITYTAIAKNQ